MSAQKPVAKLVCTAGNATGKEFRLHVERVVIGRSSECEVSLPDGAMSRQHARLRKRPEAWTLRDLGSGNGTLLNAAPVTKEMPLRSGDLITLGDTELTFFDGHSPAQVAPRKVSAVKRRGSARRWESAETGAPRTRKRKWVWVVFALVVGGFAAFASLRFWEVLRAESARQEEAERKEQQMHARMLQTAKDMARSGNWIGSKAQLDKLTRLSPNYPGVQEILANAKREIPNQELLRDARAALEKNRLGSAASALAKVSNDTALGDVLRGLRLELEEKARARVLSAQDAFTAKRYKEALDVTDDVLAAYPENREAKTLNAQARKAMER